MYIQRSFYFFIVNNRQVKRVTVIMDVTEVMEAIEVMEVIGQAKCNYRKLSKQQKKGSNEIIRSNRCTLEVVDVMGIMEMA